jgi:ELWxxDGT repeat protein
MRKVKFLLLTAFLFSAGCMSVNAQDTSKGEVIDLLPQGVTANVNAERKQDKAKNIVVAGSPTKGYRAFFAATDADHGEELWVTDGTKEGTHMVKDIQPGSGSSSPSYLGRLNDKVLFAANAGDGTGVETWVSDGTEAGTFMLVDSYTVGDGDPNSFIQMDETHAIFRAVDDESAEFDVDRGIQHWLWITDGTVDGTHRVVASTDDQKHQADLRFPGQDNTTLHTAYVRVGRRVFFKADNINGTTGEELWVTDGTANGTFEVMDVNWEKYGEGQTGYAEGWTRNCGLDNMENYKNKGVFFQAWTPDFGGEPWYSVGSPDDAYAVNTKQTDTNAGDGDAYTYMIKDTKPGKDASGIGYHAGTFGVGWEVYKDRFWWRGWDDACGYEIAGSNMTKGDYKFFDVWDEEPSVDHNSYSDPGCIFDGVYMFCAAHGFDAARTDNYGGEMWCTDGDKIWLQYDLCPGTMCDWIKEETVAGGSLYWYNEANDYAQGFGTGLYRLDSKDAIPVVCPTITSTGDGVNTLRNLNGTIIYAASATNRVYTFKYTKPNWDGKSDFGYIEPDFGDTADAIQTVNANTNTENVNVYSIDGAQVRSSVNKDNATRGLAKGIYIVGSKKVVVR